jgi:hypothetical protein
MYELAEQFSAKRPSHQQYSVAELNFRFGLDWVLLGDASVIQVRARNLRPL